MSAYKEYSFQFVFWEWGYIPIFQTLTRKVSDSLKVGEGMEGQERTYKNWGGMFRY